MEHRQLLKTNLGLQGAFSFALLICACVVAPTANAGFNAVLTALCSCLFVVGAYRVLYRYACSQEESAEGVSLGGRCTEGRSEKGDRGSEIRTTQDNPRELSQESVDTGRWICDRRGDDDELAHVHDGHLLGTALRLRKGGRGRRPVHLRQQEGLWRHLRLQRASLPAGHRLHDPAGALA
eukprot:scaffold940_cov262-Pinguiococcus_pyrenoidosus.AAC.6